MKQLLILLPLIFTSCKVAVTPQPLFHPAVKNALSTKSPHWVDSLSPEELNRTNGFGRSALTYAVLQGNAELAKKLVECGADLRSEDQWELSPLEYSALFKGQRVDFGFPDSLTLTIDTAAVLQAWSEQDRMLNIIRNNLNAGDFKKAAEYIPFADLHTPIVGSTLPYGSFFTPFLSENRYEICRFLLEEVKLYPDTRGEEGYCGFHLIDPQRDSASLEELLLKSGADINSFTASGTHLSTALVKYDDTLLLKRFETAGMEIVPHALSRAVLKKQSGMITYLSSRTVLIDSSRAKYTLAEMNDSLLLNALFDSVTYDDKLIRLLSSPKNDQTLPWLLARDIPLKDSLLINRCGVSLPEPAANHLAAKIADSLIIAAFDRAVNGGSMLTAAALLRRIDTLPDSLKNYPAREADNIDTTLMKLLVEKGADINLPSNGADYALIRALEKGNNTLLKWLIERGVDLNSRDKQGYTALIRAARYNNRTMVELLLDSGADISIKTDEGRSFLFELIHRDSSSYEPVVTGLLKNGGDTLAIAGVHEKDSSGNTLFTEMCETRDTAAQNFYLKLTKGSGFPRKEELGVALVKAARNRDPLAFQLIERGASLDLQDQYGNTPLHNALEKKFDTLSTLLIEKGADLNKRNMHDMVPLFSLLWTDRYEPKDLSLMNALIDSGADLSFVNSKGEGVLSYITDTGVSMDLIKRGAPVDVKTVDSSLVATVIKSGDPLWAAAVIEKSKRLNAPCDEFGNTPLALAVMRNRLETAELLIKKGAKRTHPSVKRAAENVSNSDMKALLGKL